MINLNGISFWNRYDVLQWIHKDRQLYRCQYREYAQSKFLYNQRFRNFSTIAT